MPATGWLESGFGGPRGGRRRRQSLALAVLMLVLLSTLWWTTAGEVSAHANLVSSEPAANSELQEAPDRIIIRFTEPIEPSLSHIRVLSASGQRVDLDNSLVDDLNPLVMSVSVGDIADGTYTVAWSNVSTVDGHRVRGSFVFAVGQPLTEAALPVVEQPLLQSPWSPVLRWLTLLAALTMVGGLVLDILVTRPVLLAEGASNAVRDAGRAVSTRSVRLVAAAAGLFLAASAGHLLLVAIITHEVSLWGAFGGPLWDTATGTDWGGLWVWRMAATLGFAVALAGIRFASDVWRTAVILLALALGCGVLWTLALVSHGAATVDIRNLAIAADFLHLVASAFWVGALFHFAAGVGLFRRLPESDRMECLADLVPRFSVVAALSLAVIVATGIFSGWAQVTVAEAVGTPYGATLVAKVALVLPLLFLGGLNLVWVRPRLRRDPKAADWLRRFLLGEAVAGRSHPRRRRDADEPGACTAGDLPGAGRATAVPGLQRHRQHRRYRPRSHSRTGGIQRPGGLVARPVGQPHRLCQRGNGPAGLP